MKFLFLFESSENRIMVNKLERHSIEIWSLFEVFGLKVPTIHMGNHTIFTCNDDHPKSHNKLFTVVSKLSKLS